MHTTIYFLVQSTSYASSLVMSLLSSLANRRTAAACLLVGAIFSEANAHAFTQQYVLPVPFEIYASGATLALLFSFLSIGWLARVPSIADQVVISDSVYEDARRPITVGRLLWTLMLLLCIASGMIGTQDPYRNINMYLFWIGFALAVPYMTVVVGDFYDAVNPWATIVDLISFVAPRAFSGRWKMPTRLGYFPALVLYMAFIWIELFGHFSPLQLSYALLGYSLLNLLGCWAVGRQAWFGYGELFAVFLRLTGKLSPFDCTAPRMKAGIRMSRWRLPFSGLARQEPAHLSLVIFILFMLSSTAFDGLHETKPWASLFWKSVYPTMAPWIPAPPGQVYLVSTRIYYGWQWFALVVSPLTYFALFTLFVWVAKLCARSKLSVSMLVVRFSSSLLPIALAYHITHYYTLLLAQAGQLWKLVSDPFGLGWNLFGTARYEVPPTMLDMNTVWHTQVALILFGHIVGVYVSHVEALKMFGTPRRAAMSQIPMLILMMIFTTFGLWILSLPIATG